MSVSFRDCEYRYIETEYDGTIYYCENKYDKDNRCDNCKENIHLDCDNYNPRKDLCLKFFQDNISSLKECQEKTIYNDKDLSRKWSN